MDSILQIIVKGNTKTETKMDATPQCVGSAREHVLRVLFSTLPVRLSELLSLWISTTEKMRAGILSLDVICVLETDLRKIQEAMRDANIVSLAYHIYSDTANTKKTKKRKREEREDEENENENENESDTMTHNWSTTIVSLSVALSSARMWFLRILNVCLGRGDALLFSGTSSMGRSHRNLLARCAEARTLLIDTVNCARHMHLRISLLVLDMARHNMTPEALDRSLMLQLEAMMYAEPGGSGPTVARILVWMERKQWERAETPRQETPLGRIPLSSAYAELQRQRDTVLQRATIVKMWMEAPSLYPSSPSPSSLSSSSFSSSMNWVDVVCRSSEDDHRKNVAAREEFYGAICSRLDALNRLLEEMGARMRRIWLENWTRDVLFEGAEENDGLFRSQSEAAIESFLLEQQRMMCV